MPPDLQRLRRRVIDVKATWPDLMLDERNGRVRKLRAKVLTATVGERVIERQCRLAERTEWRDGDQA